jgi:DNA primase
VQHSRLVKGVGGEILYAKHSKRQKIEDIQNMTLMREQKVMYSAVVMEL